MARTKSWFRSALVCGLSAMLACSGSEPTDNGLEARRPELVYAERDERTLLWSIRGYTDGLGSYEIVPGPKNVPRPATPWTKMRPTTGELLYSAEDPRNGRYILLNPSSGEFSRPALPDNVVSWSPTGDLLTAFTVNGLQVVTLDGTVRGTICSGPFICEPVEWTPAGDAVIVARREGGTLFDLWRVPLDGGAAANLTGTEGESELAASHSPDGRSLAYSRSTAPPDRPGEYDVWLAGADGTDPRPLIAPANPWDRGTLPWSPDGSRLAVYVSEGDLSGLVVVPLTGEPRLISPGEILGIPSDIDWSPDGNRLAYTAYDPAESSVPGVFLINRDGTGRRLLNRPNHDAATPHWLPPQP
jgi:Tol biopolymer transport system component